MHQINQQILILIGHQLKQYKKFFLSHIPLKKPNLHFQNSILKKYKNYSQKHNSCFVNNNNQSVKLSCYSCNKFILLIKDCPVLHSVANQERIFKKANYPFLQERNYNTLKESKQNLNIVKEFQSNYAFDNVSCIDEELEDSQSELAVSPQEYSSQTKSLSKLSRQQSQNRSLSQDNHLQPIQESDSSKDSGGLQNPRVKQTKQTIQTAGFCVTDSIHNKLASIKEEQLTDSLQDRQQQSSVNISISNLQKYEDFKFSLKNDQYLFTNNDNQRQSNQTIGLVKKSKKDDSLKFIQSQTQLVIIDGGQRTKYVQLGISKQTSLKGTKPAHLIFLLQIIVFSFLKSPNIFQSFLLMSQCVIKSQEIVLSKGINYDSFVWIIYSFGLNMVLAMVKININNQCKMCLNQQMRSQSIRKNLYPNIKWNQKK